MNNFSQTAVCFVSDFKYLYKNFTESTINLELRVNKGDIADDKFFISNIFN